jgi:hypothetical protein
MKEAIVGTWSLLIDECGQGRRRTRAQLRPQSDLRRDVWCRWSLLRDDHARRSFQVRLNNRTTGTADENKAVVTGSNAFFGTYALNEADKSLPFRVEGTFPNLEGTVQKRTITSLTAGDELTWTNPANHGEVAWKWVK